MPNPMIADGQLIREALVQDQYPVPKTNRGISQWLAEGVGRQWIPLWCSLDSADLEGQTMSPFWSANPCCQSAINGQMVCEKVRQ